MSSIPTLYVRKKTRDHPSMYGVILSHTLHIQRTITFITRVQCSSRYREIESSLLAPRSSARQCLQVGQRTIEDVAVAAIRIASSILPDGLIWPATRDGPGTAAAISRQHQRTGCVEGRAVSRASGPPIIGAVYHRIPRRLAVVSVDETLNPADHCGRRQTIACGARGVVFNVQHPREGDAVPGPTAAMSKEVVGLCGARAAIRMGEMVPATDQARGGCAAVMRAEA